MKKTYRLLAMLMALLMVVNISALATEGTGISMDAFDMAVYNRVLQSANQASKNAEYPYWATLSADAWFNEEVGLGASLGTIPANSLVKVIKYDATNMVYQVEYEHQIGYVMNLQLASKCVCENSSVTDPATHSADCVYPQCFVTLAHNKSANELYNMWSSFTAEEQAYILAYLKEYVGTTYTELYPMLNSATQEKTEKLEDTNTTVTVKGDIPADVTLELAPVSDETLANYIPNISSIAFSKMQLDITLQDANGDVYQPSSAVQVTISANGLGNDGDVIALFHIHDGKVEFIGMPAVKNGNISFTMDGFSYIMGVNVSEDCSDGEKCGYSAFESKTIAEKEEALADLFNNVRTAYDIFMSHVITFHADEANICLCYGEYDPATYGYGTINHTGYWDIVCPWHFNQIPVEDQAAVLESITDTETRDKYLATLDADQKTALDVYLNGGDEAAQLKNALIAKYSQEAIDKWFEDIEPDPTVEMMQRALNASALTNVVFEGDKLYSVYTGVQLATYNAETGLITDIETGLSFHIDELTADTEEEQG